LIKYIDCTNGSIYRVGYSDNHARKTVTKIVSTVKAGQSAYVPWYEVMAKDEKITEVNAAHVQEIGYFTEGEEYLLPED
jgi:hypothetical protein